MKDTLVSNSPVQPGQKQQIVSAKPLADNTANVNNGSSALSARNCFTKADQLKMVNENIDKPLALNDKWYLVNSDWFTRWFKYIGYKVEETSNISPDKINNKSLLLYNERTKRNSLREDILEEVDYYTVSHELWTYLVSCYGLSNAENTDVIERQVIDDSADQDGFTLRIEIRPLNVSLSCRSWKPDMDNKIVVEEMSRQTKLTDVMQRIRALFEIPDEKKLKLYFKSQDEKNVQALDLTKNTTLATSGYGVYDIILAEVVDSTATGVSTAAVATNPPKQVPPSMPATTTLAPTTFTTHTRQSARNVEYNSYSNRHSDYKPGNKPDL